jgi:hypothetical protein
MHETLNTTPPQAPIELCPAHVPLVFLHMFFGPAWFYAARFYMFFCSTKNSVDCLWSFLFCCLSADSKSRRLKHKTWYYPLAKIQPESDTRFHFDSNNSHGVKKSNPAAEPHGSPQGCTVRPRKGAGQSSMGRGGVFRVSPPMPCWCIFRFMTTFTLCFMMGKGHDSRHSLNARLGSASTSSYASYLMNAHPRVFYPIHFIYPLDKL